MKLLVLTQKVDRDDPVLGFFHRWVEELAKRFDRVTVIALGVGDYALPGNVKVLSLGKEEGASRLTYLRRFYSYVWSERKNYDRVFVHMNQEYVILGSDSWLLFQRKPVYLWRNHAAGSFLTRWAVWLSRKVFYTSPSSYTTRFKKAVQMPVGIDTDFFSPDPSVARTPHSFLFLGRIGPVKRVIEFVDWFKALGPGYTATIAGAALPKDRDYEAEARRRAPQNISFVGAVRQEGARDLYRRHETYVNKTPAGSFDKTIFEAAACEMKLVLDNADLKHLEKMSGAEARAFVVENHSLALLAKRLEEEMS